MNCPFFIALQGMTKWENNFIEEDIDLHVFLTLDDEDLKKIGNKKYTLGALGVYNSVIQQEALTIKN